MTKKKSKIYSTGRFSAKMKRDIPIWKKKGWSLEEIANEVDRSPAGIQRFLDEEGYLEEENPAMNSDVRAVRIALKKKPYWRNLQSQFDKDELLLFEQMWIRMMMEQFRQDLLPAEELQVKQLLTLYIFADRSAKERRDQIKDMKKIQVQLDKAYAVTLEDRDRPRIESLENRLKFVQSTVSNHTTEHTRLLDKIERINKDLKATRDQRVKKIEDSKTSFSGLIKTLDDEVFRKRMGQEAELMNIAKDQAMEILSDYHEYGTGTDYAEVDIPILNAETVMKHDDI